MSDLQRIIWLASYPKSGNTWLRVLLANYFMPAGAAPGINELHRFTTADVRQDFWDRAAGRPFASASFEEWLALRPKVLRAIALSKQGHHFVKTHSKVGRVSNIALIPPDVTAAAVYVLRNPFDVAVSYARHMNVDHDRIIEIMMDPRAMTATDTRIYEFLGGWDEHVQSWTKAPGLPLHVLRYEDMIDDTDKAIRALFRTLKTPVDDAARARAIGAATFGNLQKQEAEQGFKERPAEMKRFFASGRSGGWREALSAPQVARLRRAFKPILKEHYPDLLTETAEIASAASRNA